MASRGRKAPKKGTGTKGVPSAARKTPVAAVDGTPAPETKPFQHNSTTNLRTDYLRADSEVVDASSAGFSTPPPGTATPLGVNGIHGSAALGSQADVMETDGLGNSILNTAAPENLDEDDAEYKTWKQVTKKDRAVAASERSRLFLRDHLNPDEPALLRNKAGMRRWMRQQKQYDTDKPASAAEGDRVGQEGEPPSATGETLAEGMEKDEDSTLPDYYDPLSAIPNLDDRWKWAEDSEGQVVAQSEDYLRIFPKGQFKAPDGSLTRKIESNMRQMQETRKICAKIGIVKQMQIQAQTYQNQFQKYEPEPFMEQDVEPVVVSEDGPLMAPWVCRAAFQRSVGKIFYHAGFEDFQPTALDAVTDVAAEFFQNLIGGLKTFHEQPQVDLSTERFTYEEKVLHALHEDGLDLEALETYVKDDVERLGSKLSVVHDRMRSHLADLLVSASRIVYRLRHTNLCCSDPHLAITSAQTALEHSTTEANNS